MLVSRLATLFALVRVLTQALKKLVSR